jgi:hypothetical protein
VAVPALIFVRVVAAAAMVVVLAVAVILVTVALAEAVVVVARAPTTAVFTLAPGIIKEGEHSGCKDLIMAFSYRLTMKFPPGI